MDLLLLLNWSSFLVESLQKSGLMKMDIDISYSITFSDG